MRDNILLKERLTQISGKLFPELNTSSIIIKFKGKSKYKFGHIKRTRNNTEIAINSLFKDLLVPQYVIDLTIAHELVHYSHGFQSPLPKKFKYPHKGGVVRKELIRKGLANFLRREKLFFKKEWSEIYTEITKKPF